MGRPSHEVADILGAVDLPVITSNTWKLRTLYALSNCRTAALGGHIDRCDNPKCNKLHLSYNSCRNRQCPKCQGHQREAWIQQREAELLNVPYYHVVFTIPDHLHALCLQKPMMLYTMLFKTAWSVIKGFGENPKFLGATTGMIAVLHTWGSNMSLHPHLHCIVPAGGINGSGKWKTTKSKGRFLFPVKAMSKVFRARFLDRLNKAGLLDTSLHKKLTARPWVIYAKRPFYGPAQVVEYLGRYTHKIAISNHRIRQVDDGSVTFSVKDYRHGGRKANCKLAKEEFVRRFSLHILPKRFVRIRHFGLLSSIGKKKYLPLVRTQTGGVLLSVEREPIKLGQCPSCKKGKLITVVFFKNGRSPPLHLLAQIYRQNKQCQRA